MKKIMLLVLGVVMLVGAVVYWRWQPVSVPPAQKETLTALSLTPVEIQETETRTVTPPPTIPVLVKVPAIPQVPVPAIVEDVLVSAAKGKPIEEIEAFNEWTTRFAGGDSSASLSEGEQLARQRREVMERLIETDPRSAVEAAVPFAVRSRLPQNIVEQLEERVGGVGSLTVTIADDFEAMKSHVSRTAEIGERRYEVYAYGRADRPVSRERTYLHGVAIRKRLALNESPLRRLEVGESIPASAVDRPCVISGQPATANGTPVYAQSESKVESFCGPAHFSEQNEQLLITASSGSGTSGGIHGVKTLVFIPTQRTGFPELMPFEAAETMMHALSNAYYIASYGDMILKPTITPTIIFPQTTTTPSYNDITTGAATEGYNVNNYNYHQITDFGEDGGWGQIIGSYSWIGLTDNRLLANSMHELSHNFGLVHAAARRNTPSLPFGWGENLEYGDSFDVMGETTQDSLAYVKLPTFSIIHKYYLGWLPDLNITSISTSGVYRIYAQDTDVRVSERAYGFRVRRDVEKDYWGEIRQRHHRSSHSMNGLILHWDEWSGSGGRTELIDTDPSLSPDGTFLDAPLLLGSTWSDSAAGIHFTPLAKGGTDPAKWMDVEVNLGGFNGNHPPTITLAASTTSAAVDSSVTFTATTSDADGDSLAYSWEFGQESAGTAFGANQTNVVKSWPTARDQVVRCVVSDKKGGVSSAYVVVRVGTPQNQNRIDGTITLANGGPLEGVRVEKYDNPAIYAYTDALGHYTLTGGSGFQVNALKFGYTFSLSSGNDFVATELPKVSISVDNPVIHEDCITPNSASFSITRTGPLTEPLDVKVMRFGTAGTADLTLFPNILPSTPPTTTTVTIPSGASTIKIFATAIPDSGVPQNEGDETLILQLKESTSYRLAYPSESVVTISNPPEVALSANPIAICDLATQGDAEITVSRAGSTDQPLAVNLETIGTAVLGAHYQVVIDGTNVSSPFTITIPAGYSSSSFSLHPINIAAYDGAKLVTCKVICSSLYQRSVPLEVSLGGPLIRLNSGLSFITEGTSPVFAVQRYGCSGQPLTVYLQTGGAAIRGSDYKVRIGGNEITANPFSVTIPASQTSAAFSITDLIVDTNRDLTISIVGSAQYSIGQGGVKSLCIRDTLSNYQINLVALPHQPASAFQFTLSGAPCGTCNVEATSDTVAWTQIGTMDSAATFQDAGAASLPRRFYRVRCGTVKSINSVGYYDLAIPPGYSMFANQLSRGGNTLDEIFPSPPLETQIQKFVSEGNYVSYVYWLDEEYDGWITTEEGLPAGSVTIAPGEGVFVYSPATGNVNHSIYGSIPASPVSVQLPPGHSIVSSVFPRSVSVDSMGVPGITGDKVMRYVNTIGNYVVFRHNGTTWVNDVTSVPVTVTPNVGESFFYFNSTPNTRTWNQLYSVFPP